MADAANDNRGEESLGRYRSSRQKRQRPKANLQPPLTPMIDVTFQLLIYFIVTATFRQAEGLIPGSLPSDLGMVDPKPRPEVPVTVTLVPQGTGGIQYQLDAADPTQDAATLFSMLRDRREAAPGAPLIVAVHPSVLWQYVVEAYNQGYRAEFKEVGFRYERGRSGRR